MMKKIPVKKYRRHLLCFEIFLVLLLMVITYNFIPVQGNTCTFYIPESNMKSVVDTLKKNGYSITWPDRVILQIIHVPEKGWYTVKSKSLSRILFFEYLYKKKAETMGIVIFGGETSSELSKRLANDMKLDKQKLLESYKRLSRFEEADLLAKHYTVARNADETTIMKYLFYRSSLEMKSVKNKHFKHSVDEMTLKVLLTIASIIQKESNTVKEMPLISSVIYNRFKKKMKLQMDSTLNYGEYSHAVVTPERIKKDTSYYNTYKYRGLPPAPLCTVTKEALEAAISPKKTEYLFFMLHPSGEHNFSVTYEEHLHNISVFRAYQKRKQEEFASN